MKAVTGWARGQGSHEVVEESSYPEDAGDVLPGGVDHVRRQDGADREIFISGSKHKQVSRHTGPRRALEELDPTQPEPRLLGEQLTSGPAPDWPPPPAGWTSLLGRRTARACSRRPRRRPAASPSSRRWALGSGEERARERVRNQRGASVGEGTVTSPFAAAATTTLTLT